MLRVARRRHVWLVSVVALPTLLGGMLAASQPAQADPSVVISTVKTSTGAIFTATNHLVDLPGVASSGSPRHKRKEYLVVWAGDANVTDTTGADIKNTPLQINPVRALNIDAKDAPPGPDFFAVIDADRDSSSYGKVVNTVTLGPLPENEPHHMQYVWHKGQKIYGGGLFSDITYVLDTSQLPKLTLSGVNMPMDTPCGSVPDAYWVLQDGTAYGTYMGGPDLPGPCAYSDGQNRFGNGFAGTPGEVVRIGPDGRTLAESPAAQAVPEDPIKCTDIPPTVPSCANPHGIQLREDLNRMITSDFAEPRDIILDPVKPPSPYVSRNTARIWDIADRNHPKLLSVQTLPDGPRRERNPAHEENQAVMETTVTNLPNHKGAFVETMCGGAIFYTPDLTAAKPQWHEVFDDTTAARRLQPDGTELGGCDGAGWVQTSGDDHYLYHAVIGRGPGSQAATDEGSPKMVYTLDISRLLAAGPHPSCSIDTTAEVYDGGHEQDCPELVSVLPITDTSTGGPHWGALDNFVRGPDGFYTETRQESRIAVSNYFVARTGIDGNHKVCMVDIGPHGRLSLDRSFRDENEGTPCVDFNRTHWPHGDLGNAKPHSSLFVVADADLH